MECLFLWIQDQNRTSHEADNSGFWKFYQPFLSCSHQTICEKQQIDQSKLLSRDKKRCWNWKVTPEKSSIRVGSISTKIPNMYVIFSIQDHETEKSQAYFKEGKRLNWEKKYSNRNNNTIHLFLKKIEENLPDQWRYSAEKINFQSCAAIQHYIERSKRSA